MRGPISIRPESPFREDVLALLRRSEAYSAALYPAESIHTLDIGALARPAVRFVVARLDDQAVGCGAFVLGPDRSAELKRMYVDDSKRGQGIGAAVLAALEDMAEREGATLMQLETGVKQPAAIGLYRRFGYKERGPFGAYRADPLSVFLEKHLAPRG
jgi:putative acetyltransferase